MSSGPSPGDSWRSVNERLLRTSRDALELGFGAAKWWTGALLDGSGVWHASDGEVVSEPDPDLAYGFPDHQLEAEVDGRRIAAKLRSIQLYRGGRDGGRLELTDFEWDGLHSKSVTVVADEVTVTPGTMMLSLAGVEIRGSVSLVQLVAWVDRRTPSWRLGVGESGFVSAASASDARRVSFAPSLEGGELVMELREVGWSRLHARVPRWLRLTRKAALPPLPDDVTVLGATPRGDEVEFVLGRPTFSRAVDLRGLLAR